MEMRHHRKYIKKPFIFNPRIQRIFGLVGSDLGESAEKRVDEAFCEVHEEGHFPEWLKRWERHKKHSIEDRNGVDLTFFTDVGPIFVQIKSSRGNAIRFQNHHRGRRVICVVVIDVRDPNTQIFNQVLTCISNQRNIFLANRC